MTPDELIDKVMNAVREKQPEHYDAWFSLIVGETLEQAAKHIETLFAHGTGDHVATVLRGLIEKQES